MKRLLFTTTLGMAIALSGPSAYAATKNKDTTPPAAPAAETTKPTPAAKGATDKAYPMHSRADTIDAKAMTFTHKNKDGKEVKHMVTSKTTIMNGDKAAKFEDIKVGDFVSGLRLKKSETEYEVVKITKFGPEEKKAADTKKPETKPKK